MSVKLTLLLLSLFIVQFEARYGCPKIQVYNRCTAWCRCASGWNWEYYAYKTVFSCDGFNGRVVELEDFLKRNLNGSDIDDFVFNNYRLPRLPDAVFERAHVSRIFITNSAALLSFGYSGTGKTVFEGLGQTLETLIIRNTPNILTEEWAIMANSLSKNGTAPPILKNLIVYGQNQQSTITDMSSFSTLTNLQKITLRNIRLNTFLDNPIDLSPFTRLRLLDLSENVLLDFGIKSLSDSLTTIYLNRNQLTRFESGFFTQINSSWVDYINVKDNKLDCDCEYVGSIVGNPLGNKFEGVCAEPRLVRGKPYGQQCFTPVRGIVDSSNIGKPEQSDQNKNMINTI